MKLSKQTGFTIVETMLFLAITGLLIFGFLANTGNAVNNQRYRDSVDSIATIIQQQYSDSKSVNNLRSSTSTMTCSSSGMATNGGAGALPVGQSDCVILGKFIRYTNDGNPLNANSKKISIRSVLGFEIPGRDSMARDNDIDSLKDFNIMPTPSPETASDYYSLDWDTTLTGTTNTTPFSFSILILRSPLSGITRTFTVNYAVADSNISTAMISLTNMNRLNLCVRYSGVRMISAVSILANATSGSAVQTQGESSGLCN